MRIEQEKGQSLVEFALVLIFVIVPFTLAFIETSILLYEYVSLTNAAREGARAGSIYLYVGDPGGSFSGPDTGRSAAVLTAVNDTLGPFIPPSPNCNGTGDTTICEITYGPSTSPVPDPLRSTDTMTVTIMRTHPFLWGAMGGDIDLQVQSSMKIEPSTVISATP
jgi:Flp pilus assembly protein TadG